MPRVAPRELEQSHLGSRSRPPLRSPLATAGCRGFATAAGNICRPRRLLQLHREELERTALKRARPASEGTAPPDESLAVLCERLRESSPVLVRNLTPPMLAG